MRHTKSRISLAASLMAVALWWLPLPTSAMITWINIELYVSGDPNLSALDPITVAQVGLQNCDPTVPSSCTGMYGGEADNAGVEFLVRNTATNLPADLGGDAFLGGLFFASPTGLDLTQFFVAAGTSEIAGFDVSGGTNAGYPYAWSVDFVNNAASGDRLLPGEFNFAKWFIEDANVNDFLVEGSANGNGNGKNGPNKPPFLVMAHMQQVGPGPGGECSLKYIGNNATTAVVEDGFPPPDQNSSTADVPDAAACASASVPEPASVALLGIGVLMLAGMTAWRRRRGFLRTDW